MPEEHPFYYWLIENFSPYFILYFAIINFCYAVFLFIGSMRVFYRKYVLSKELPNHTIEINQLPKLTFIIPALNEQDKILDKLENTLALDYPSKEIIIVDDGSTDDMIDVLKKNLQLILIPKTYDDKLSTQSIKAIYQSKKHREIFVIAKEHGKKHDALNAGVNAATSDFVITTDVDTFIDEKEFKTLIRPLFSDPNAVAVGASVRVKNGVSFQATQAKTQKFPQSILSGLQAIEYLRSFFIRMGIDGINAGFVISGCFTIFPTKLLIEVSGFAPTVAEDMEIIIRFQRILRKKKVPFKIFYVPDPVVWTEVPDTLRKLGRQRANWQRGLMESFWFHKPLFFNPFYKMAGIAAYPFGLIFEILEPFIELLGFVTIITGYYLGLLGGDYFFLLIAFSYGFTFFISVSCLFIEELSFDKFPKMRTTIALIALSLYENIGYRQLNLIWRLKGIMDFILRLPFLIKANSKLKKAITNAIRQK